MIYFMFEKVLRWYKSIYFYHIKSVTNKKFKELYGKQKNYLCYFLIQKYKRF